MRNGQPLVPRTGLEKRNAGADPSRFEGRPKLVESYERTNSIKPAEGQTLEAIEEYGVKKRHSIPKSVGCFAVVTDAEAQFAGLSLELLDIALGCLGETKECGEDAHGGVTVEPPDVSAGPFGPGDFPHA